MGCANVIALAIENAPQAGPPAPVLIAEARDAAELREQDRERTAWLKGLFERWAARAREAGIAAQWRKGARTAYDPVLEAGRRSDFIVIARPADDDDTRTRNGFRAALVHSERPVLVVPPGHTTPFGRNVAIAWRDDGCAVEAVVPALRFLANSEKINVLHGSRTNLDNLPVPSVLQAHGIAAEVYVLPIQRAFGRALLDKAHAVDADMLVMGANSHGRWRALILGGVTRYMLDHADLPVLMRH